MLLKIDYQYIVCYFDDWTFHHNMSIIHRKYRPGDAMVIHNM
jgi:hypothetical protein